MAIDTLSCLGIRAKMAQIDEHSKMVQGGEWGVFSPNVRDAM